MDLSQAQLFGHSVISPSDLSSSSSSSSSTSHPASSTISLFDSLKFSLVSSPISPFDCKPITPLFSSSPDNQHSSNDNLSIASPPCSSMDYDHQDNSFRVHSNGHEKTQSIGHTLRQLESHLLASDDDEEPLVNSNKRAQSYDCQSGKRHKAMGCPPGYLKHLLVSCAEALYDNRNEDFENLIKIARESVSIVGEPIQRLGAYMVEGLVARRNSSGTSIYKSLRCNNEQEAKDLRSYTQIIYEICPYLKFGYMAANGAIAKACRNEDRIHIIDFQVSQGAQWTTLLQALAARPGGPPRVRITGVGGDNLDSCIGAHLDWISNKWKIPIEFNSIPVFSLEMMDIRQGEALAVNFPLKLHHIADESVDVNNPRDRLLRAVRSMNPRVVTLVEQESNTNTLPFVPRFVEALDYYSAVFESMDGGHLDRGRVNAEERCLGRDIVNVIGCEGKEREERHELFGKWRSRFMMAGFRQYRLSSYVNSVIRDLLKFYSENYRVLEIDGGLLLGWKQRNLVSASAWH